jgi:hypothetical protein
MLPRLPQSGGLRIEAQADRSGAQRAGREPAERVGAHGDRTVLAADLEVDLLLGDQPAHYPVSGQLHLDGRGAGVTR